MRHQHEQDLVLRAPDLFLAEEPPENGNLAEDRQAGPRRGDPGLVQAADDARFALPDADVMHDRALPDHGLGDAADVHAVADVRDLDLHMHRHVPVRVDLRREGDVDAHVLVVELRVDQRVDAHAAHAGLEAAGSDRNAVSYPEIGLLVVRRSHARRLQQFGVGVAEQRAEDEVGQGGRPTGRADVAQPVERYASCRAGACCALERERDPGSLGRARQRRKAKRAHPRLVRLEHEDIDDHLRPRLVHVVDDLFRDRDHAGASPHDDRAERVQREDPVDLGNAADRGDHFHQILGRGQIGQIDGLDDPILILPALGLVVVGDKHRIARERFPEGFRDQADVVERLRQRGVPEFDVDIGIREVRVKQHVDAGQLAEGLEDDPSLLVQHQVDGLVGQGREFRRLHQRAYALRDLVAFGLQYARQRLGRLAGLARLVPFLDQGERAAMLLDGHAG